MLFGFNHQSSISFSDIQGSNIDRRDTPNGGHAIYSAHGAADAVHLRPEVKASAPRLGPRQRRASLRPTTRQASFPRQPTCSAQGTQASVARASAHPARSFSARGFGSSEHRRRRLFSQRTIVEKKVTSVQIAPSRTKETRITRASIAKIQVMKKT